MAKTDIETARLVALQQEIDRSVTEMNAKNAEERSVVQNGLEVFHRVQIERDTKVAQVIELERKLAVSENERDQWYGEMVRYKRRAEHFERLNTAVNTQLQMVHDAITAAKHVATTHSYGDRPSGARKLSDVDTKDVPRFLQQPMRGVPEKVS
jgi:dipeptidyl aminopeptidase/acylaminoacyl peptidase